MKARSAELIAAVFAALVVQIGTVQFAPVPLALAQEPAAGDALPQYTPEQLEQLLAPVALYPDTLLGDILMAATYPLEVVEAERWLQDPANAALQGDDLVAALEQAPWDPSVKTLVSFPQILRMLDGSIDTTEQLGDAFLADQAGVMDAVQRLRQRAQAAGHLQTTPQEQVAWDGPDLTITPANPDVVYVPVYDPDMAYGVWPYPSFMPYAFPDTFDGVAIGAFGFGWIGVGIVAPLWVWNRWDWHHRRIDIDGDHVGRFDRQPPPGGAWQHDPAHRHGVPYAAPAVRDRFGAESARRSGGEIRGFPPAVAAQAAPRATPGVSTPQAVPRASPGTAMPAPHAPPAFESFGRGSDVREEQDRGRSSRISVPQVQPRTSAPMPAPRGGASPSFEKPQR